MELQLSSLDKKCVGKQGLSSNGNFILTVSFVATCFHASVFYGQVAWLRCWINTIHPLWNMSLNLQQTKWSTVRNPNILRHIASHIDELGMKNFDYTTNG